jgi:hypothetical protein
VGLGHDDAMTDPDPLIHAFYRDRYVEDDRLSRTAHGQLEFLRTQELLRRYLPVPPATVLDGGGATGGPFYHLVEAADRPRRWLKQPA